MSGSRNWCDRRLQLNRMMDISWQAFVRSLRRGIGSVLRCAPCRALCDPELLRAPRSCSLEATRTVMYPAPQTAVGSLLYTFPQQSLAILTQLETLETSASLRPSFCA